MGTIIAGLLGIGADDTNKKAKTGFAPKAKLDTTVAREIAAFRQDRPSNRCSVCFTAKAANGTCMC